MPALLQRGLFRPGLAASLAAFALAFPLRAADKNPVIVHEWGTFTSLQDEKGQTIGGINVDDEPAPNFVNCDGGQIIISEHFLQSRSFGLPPYWGGKEWAANDPSVTMRLETPVLYIYPPKGEAPKSVPPLTVHVDFHGGVLSEFYPEAKFDGAGLIPGTTVHRETLTDKTTTSLTWNGVRLGSTRKPVETDDHVWTTPRETSAPLLEVKTHSYDAQGKIYDDVTAEHFLFYRGVGHLDSPLRLVSQDKAHIYPVIDTWFGAPLSPTLKREAADMSFSAGWFVEIRPDGRCAFRPTECLELEGNSFVMRRQMSAAFSESDFSATHLADLQVDMQRALVHAGLFADEASAMLRTWDVSYFKSPGVRFFYLVSPSWTNRVLPLQISGAPATITRVMIGRIEMISKRQKAALARLAAGPCPDLDTVKKAAKQALASGKYSEGDADAFYRGDRPLRDLGIAIPPEVQDYLDLGRFRDVLILREQKLHPSPMLAEFIKRNGLGEQVAGTDSARLGGVVLTR